jgi:hypothetical protein
MRAILQNSNERMQFALAVALLTACTANVVLVWSWL